MIDRPNPTEGVLSEAWELYKAHFQHLVGIALIVYLGVALVSLVLVAIAGIVGAIIAGLASIVGWFWVQGALVKAVEDIRDGRADMGIGDTFRAVGPNIGAIAGASILAGIGILIGLFLLIVPGLILMTLWSVIVPVIVLEGKRTFESFGRSQELVRPHGLQVFGVIALTILAFILLSIVLAAVLSPLDPVVQRVVADIVSGALVTPFMAMAWTLLYYRLRDARRPAGTV